jgi:hypothetical protein
MASAFTERPALRYAGDLPQELRSVPREPRPVVITGVHAFMELWFYSEPDLRDRLVYLVDPELEKYYLHTDTTSRILSALRRRMPLGVADYDSFIAANPTFILAGEPVDWISLQLHRLNYRFAPLGGGANSKIYEVKAPLDNPSIGELPPVGAKSHLKPIA